MSQFKAVMALLVAIIFSTHQLSPAFGQDDQSAEDPTLNFIGFNTLLGGQDASDGFDAYIAGITPIMARHGLSLLAFDAEALADSDLKTTVITFGSGPASGLAAFFEDPEFLSLFPDLLAVLADHNVVFTEDDIGPNALADRDAILGVFWPGVDLGFHGEANMTRGTMASHGIADTIEPLDAPGLVMVFRGEMDDDAEVTTRWVFRLAPRE